MPRMHFKGKSVIANHHLAVPYHHLQADEQKSVLDSGAAPSLHDNLIVHGDNLLALKALLPSYAGKINCIYIDPPYNTGNEKWVYNDNVNNAMLREWLGKVVDAEDLTRHDKWLCMMWPRLSLLHELLAEDGVIFISIDDNEQHRLRMVMDEIFGEKNFAATIIWEKIHSTKNDAKYFSDNHDFILVYAKSKEHITIPLLPRTAKMDMAYKNIDNDPRGGWTSGDLVASEERREGYYEVKGPTGKSFNVPKGKHWVYSQENMKKLNADNRIWFGVKGDAFPRLKRFLSEVQQGKKANTIWQCEDVGHNQEAIRETKSIFADTSVDFATPKPIRLIKQILKLSAKNAIVLDSFAGSGTTAQAVLELNQEDGGDRKFILVECEEYADKITAERVRRVIKGVPNAKSDALKAGLGGAFSYWELGGALELQSILEGEALPSFADLARYVFFTATGEQWNERDMRPADFFIGQSSQYEVYMLYKPDVRYLTRAALTLDIAQKFPKATERGRLIFAPARYASLDELRARNITYCQLPFEIYRKAQR